MEKQPESILVIEDEPDLPLKLKTTLQKIGAPPDVAQAIEKF